MNIEGYRVEIDLSTQRLALEMFEEWRDPRDAPLIPTLEAYQGRFVSAALLLQKAKQLDDGLYASAEIAAQRGLGHFSGKAALLEAVGRHLAHHASPDRSWSELDRESVATFLSALELGRIPVEVPSPLSSAVKNARDDFLADPDRSKPIGFYTWGDDLERVFRQDRMLQTPLRGARAQAEIAIAIANSPELRETYERYLLFTSRLTNPFPSEAHDFRARITAPTAAAPPMDSRRDGRGENGVFFFPPSRAHETELMKRMFASRPIPGDFDLAEELIARVMDGRLSLEPTSESGWYDHQLWSIEPLVRPRDMLEGAHFSFNEEYEKYLRELFKGIYALTRETHIKQLESPPCGAARSEPPPKKVLYVVPELSAEPLVASYLRRAKSYAFVRSVLVETFGPDALREMKRRTPDGTSRLSLADELAEMESILCGACASIHRDIGMPESATASLFPDRDPQEDADVFSQWAGELRRDPDLARDARMMVPVFYDIARNKMKVWAFLGWREKHLSIRFEGRPSASVFDRRGRDADQEVDLLFGGASEALYAPVVRELYVDAILDRKEFRKLCDRHKSERAILEQLAG